ncbi:hypothetical protein llg_23040 [Luteolibacter sp. LG18]|nr:hypothetical protein llg_23040 [Luteolibacter sp. LG18]
MLAGKDLQGDIERVTGKKPEISKTLGSNSKSVIIAGTLGKSAAIDALVKAGKINVSPIVGKWESFLITVVRNPALGVDLALVIVGSDKRGTIFGLYEMSEQIGVSPWYWWADVAVPHQDEICIRSGEYLQGPPGVKYRGIFLNDEAPALSGWAKEKFGGFNKEFYKKVFELILRLRGNYLWPAMWGNAFNEDDPANPQLADEYGIVMGTSHHEPMLRAQAEWKKHGVGPWNYATNQAVLKRFWEAGIERNRKFESIVTIGMRGDGDEPMVNGGDMSANSQLLERIIRDQRGILSRHVNPDPTKVPQLWALYKEVLEYYNHGLRVPDDVTLLWCDDNWGNIRRLPTAEERKRSGGAGVYYHFDYVGGPRNYKWINTNPLPKVWEQMNLAHQYGANRIWIVNVGDLKPMEVPMEFFLRMAWNPGALSKDDVSKYTQRWAAREFGRQRAVEIAEVVATYAKYNGWRKPELLSPETFSLIHYREAELVSKSWNDLLAKAESIDRDLPEVQKASFYQLVLHPVRASATVADLYIALGRNKLYASQGRASANVEAARVRELFERDKEITDHYNRKISGGKWNHLMDQTHIGYTGWQQPAVNILPEVTENQLSENSSYGVTVEGSVDMWPGCNPDPSLPRFDSLGRQRSYVEVCALGTGPVDFKFHASHPWIKILPDVEKHQDQRLWVDIDWGTAPIGESEGYVSIEGGAGTVKVHLTALRATADQEREAKGCFGGLSGPIAIAAKDAVKSVAVGQVHWDLIPDYGRAKAGVSVFPVTAASILPPAAAPYLEYPVYLAKAGNVDVDAIIGSTLDFVPGRGLRLAVSIDDAPPEVVDAFPGKESESRWGNAVKDNIRILRLSHVIDRPGRHVLRIAMVDPGVVLQKLIIHQEPLPPSYFGPPEVGLNVASR